MRRTISNVLVTEQQGIKIYTFAMAAETLAQVCRVEHFWTDLNGVNRKFDEKHMAEIAVAMSAKEAGKVLWLEPFIVAFMGKWTFIPDKQSSVTGSLMTEDPGAYLSVDDGQHRSGALKSGLLTAAEIEALSFNVTGTIGLSLEMRMRIFRMQAARKAIDPRLDLAQREKLGDWKSERDHDAYSLVRALAESQVSPLCGLIQIEEGRSDKRPIPAHGLYGTIKMLSGVRSSLHGMLPAKRAEVVTCVLRVVSEIWSEAWKSEKHILRTARGVNAVLTLFVSGTNFRQALGTDVTEEAIRRAYGLAKDFDWSASKFSKMGRDLVAEKLEEAIRKNLSKQRRRSSAESATPAST